MNNAVRCFSFPQKFAKKPFNSPEIGGIKRIEIDAFKGVGIFFRPLLPKLNLGSKGYKYCIYPFAVCRRTILNKVTAEDISAQILTFAPEKERKR